MGKKTVRLALLGLSTSVALILSYIEFLLPPLFTAVPGIKIGLANVIIIFLLYRLDFLSAATVSLVRVCLSSLLFGSVMTFAYSIAGAVMSLAVMVLMKRCALFSTVGVSIAGGVSHNLGQILMAMLLLNTRELIYYMVVLAVTGTVSGIFIGLAASLLIKRIGKF